MRRILACGLGTSAALAVVMMLLGAAGGASAALDDPPPPQLWPGQPQISGTGSLDLLLIPDSTNRRVMAFDPTTGDLVDADFIPADPAHLTQPINAILSAGGNSVLVSDQLNDVVQEYDLNGNYRRVFAPAGGPNLAVLDNILGIALQPNGNLLVTVDAGANAHSVAEFDTNGSYLGQFIAAGAGGLNGPFDIFERPGNDWLVSSINTDSVLRYDLATGALITPLATVSNFPEQIALARNGNVLVANFGGAQMGLVELSPAGALVDVITATGLSNYRGVYELPNLRLLVSTSSGVFEIDRAGTVLITKTSGVSARYIELVRAAGLQLDKTVGTDPHSCAVTDAITARRRARASLSWKSCAL